MATPRIAKFEAGAGDEVTQLKSEYGGVSAGRPMTSAGPPASSPERSNRRGNIHRHKQHIYY